MPISDPLVMPLARDLLECYAQELAKVENPPMHVGLRPGNVVAHLLSTNDDECCEGLAWVRPDLTYPSSGTFPAQDEQPMVNRGVSAWAVTLELGAVRCAPTPDADAIPTAEQWDDATQAQMDDAAAMRRAICCLIAEYGSKRVMPGAWQPLAVEGGCLGGIMTVVVRGPACDCSEAGPESS
jgi:hypothetical protein